MSTKDRGFGSMDRVKQREIASKGGKAAQAAGTAHQWNSAEAAAAGRKGGLVSRGGKGRLGTAVEPEIEPTPINHNDTNPVL